MHQMHRRNGPPANCGNVSPDVLSCYPTSGQKVVQDSTLVFVWNNQVPAFVQAGAVDVYLFHADTKTEVTAQTAIPNSQGKVSFTADDEWWWKGLNTWTGTNQTFPMFFVVAPVGITPLTPDSASYPPQAQFSAIETRAPNSVSASPTGKTTTTSHSSTTPAGATTHTTASASTSAPTAPSQTSSTSISGSTPVASLTSSPAGSHSASKGGIIGGIIGGLLFILAIVGFMILLRRRARIRRRESTARHQKMRQINSSDARRSIFPLPTSQPHHNSSPSQQQLRPRRSPSPSPSLDRTGVLSWEHNEQEPLGPNPFADRMTLSSSVSEASFDPNEEFDRSEMVSPLYDVDAHYTVSVEDQEPHHVQGASHTTEPIP